MQKSLASFIDEIVLNLEDLDEWLQTNKNIAVCDAIYRHKQYYQDMLNKLLEWETIH